MISSAATSKCDLTRGMQQDRFSAIVESSLSKPGNHFTTKQETTVTFLTPDVAFLQGDKSMTTTRLTTNKVWKNSQTMESTIF